MKQREITQKADTELEILLIEARDKLAVARIDMRTKQMTNVKQIHSLKRTIARILTNQKLRELTKLEESNG